MSMEDIRNSYRDGRTSGYMQALHDIERLLDNSVSNGGGIDVGNGLFIERAHWNHEIHDQIIQLRDEWRKKK